MGKIMIVLSVAFAFVCILALSDAQATEAPAVVQKIACMRTTIPSAMNTKVEECCKGQENGCRKLGHFRTAFFCAVKANPTSTGANDFETIRTTCTNDPKNKNKDKELQAYKIRDCIFDTMERNCTQRKAAVSGRRTSGR